jgi:predicted RNA methylase
LTPFTTKFTASEIAFHLLDINNNSLEAAKKLYGALQIEQYVEEWICADATTYKIPDGTIIHLMISETMLNALRKEPQVAIMLNLVPQLPERGLFVPQEITVSAQLLDGQKESARHLEPDKEPERLNLGVVYSIGRTNCKLQETIIIEIPANIENHKSLYLLTDITVFEKEKLGAYNSSLNMPFKLGSVEGFEGKKIVFKYEMGEKPGFVYEYLH